MPNDTLRGARYERGDNELRADDLGLYQAEESKPYRERLVIYIGEQRDGCMISAVFEPKGDSW